MPNEDICITCPHCHSPIMVYAKDINCAIFRHGVMKKTGLQIDQHLPKIVCDELAREGKIYGCGKPFKLINKDNVTYLSEVCAYI